MEDGKVDACVFLFCGLGLHAVEIQMAEGAGCDHDIGAMSFGVPGMGGYHG